MRKLLVSVSLCALVQSGCGPKGNGGRGGNGHPTTGTDGGTNNNDNNTGSDGGFQPPPGCKSTGGDPDADQDQDGYTPALGDCDDCNPTINPGAIQIPGDPTDYACNKMPGVLPTCDSANTGMRDPTSLANAVELCDSRFFQSATLVGPSDQRGRKVLASFGVLKPQAGANFALLSSGIAADKSDPDFDKTMEEDPGTNFGNSNTFANPQPNLPGVMGCSQSQPATVNDYTELVVKLKAPTNANSFSFDFQFFSAEYPQYVCTMFNDEFLVLQESAGEFATPTNIAFDMNKNPITINNGFFSVCTNNPDMTSPNYKYTQNCKHPVTDIAGTGFDDPPGGPLAGFPGVSTIPGGSTGWLTTTAPVTPGEEVTLHFIIFDEGDHILDSAALIDNFRWGTTVIMTPSTGPIS